MQPFPVRPGPFVLRSDVIALPYLLVLNVPLHSHAGSYRLTRCGKDLEPHRAQISRLFIACPVARRAPPSDWQRLSATGLPSSAARNGPVRAPVHAAIGRAIVRAISHARIVHVGVAGWPFPLGWLGIPIARMRRRPLVVGVESAFWRIPPGTAASAPARARARLWERVNRRAVAACDVSFFTTCAYLDQLHRGARGWAHILPAVSIDDDALIDPARLAGRTHAAMHAERALAITAGLPSTT